MELKDKSRIQKTAPVLLLGLLVLGLGAGLFFYFKSNFPWLFTHLQPLPSSASPLAGQILYLYPAENPEIWTSRMDGSNPRTLTKTGGKVLDYAISREGWQVLYSVLNNQGGSDLHLLRLDGSYDQTIVNCGSESCDSPAWACDGKQAAFRRGQSSLTNLQPGDVAPLSSRIYTLDISTGAVQLFQSDRNFTGTTPAWSNNCDYFSFYDTEINSIRLIDAAGEKGNVLLPAIFLAGWSWSPDNEYLYFINQSTPEDFSHGAEYRYNLKTGKAELAFPESADIYDYSSVSFAPDGSLVFGRREVGGSPTWQIWMVNAGSLQPAAVTSDQQDTHTNASWDSTGKYLVYQQYALNDTTALPEVWVWNRLTSQKVQIVQDAGFPVWVASK